MLGQSDEEGYSGRWVSAWEAFTIAKERMDRAGGPSEPVGQTMLRHAAEGYLPAATNDMSHTVPIAAEVNTSAESTKPPTWRVLPRSFWRYFVNEIVDGNHVVNAASDWKSGVFSYMLSNKKIGRAASIVELFGTDFYMCFARNVSFYEPGLWGIANRSEDMDETARFPLHLMEASPPAGEMPERWATNLT
jgi:hypothetical protein